MFKPLDKMRYSEQVANQIRERILDGRLKQDERLPSEQEMAEEFEVSRTVIRESMRILECLGLVNIRKGPQGGIFVNDGYHKPMSDSLSGLVETGRVSVDQIFEARFLLGPHIAETAAGRAVEKDIRELHDIMDVSEQHNTDPVFLRKNRSQFHLRLAKATYNPVLEMLMTSLLELLRIYFHDFKDLAFEKRTVKKQRQIIKAIEARNPEQARDLMKAYLLDLKKRVRILDKSSP